MEQGMEMEQDMDIKESEYLDGSKEDIFEDDFGRWEDPMGIREIDSSCLFDMDSFGFDFDLL